MAKLLSSLPVGTKIKDTDTKYNGQPIIWQIMEHGHSGDPSGSTALVTEKIITLKCFDAIESSNSDSSRKKYGNNRYLYSNIKQWLNSDKAAGNWYAAQHSADAAPTGSNVLGGYNDYNEEAGFLTNFSSQLKSALLTTTKKTAKNTATDGGSYESVSGKVFLLSNTEVGLSNENSIEEGSIYELFNTSSNRKAYPTAEAVSESEYTSTSLTSTSPWYWWLRTPNASYSYRVRSVSTDGSLGYNLAYRGDHGFRPACVLPSSILVSDAADTDGVYTIIWNAPPTIETDSEENLGDKNTPFVIKYTINDEDGDEVTAKVLLDEMILQTLNPVIQGQQYTVEISGEKLSSLTVGRHVIKIQAEDSNENTSEKSIEFNKTSSSITISGTDENLGNKWEPFTFTYQVSDSLSNDITVTEYVDDEEVRTIKNASQNTDISFNLSKFDTLENEKTHKLTIKAVNTDKVESYRYINFKKLCDKLKFETKPVGTDAPAEKIIVNLKYDNTGDPYVLIEVTNCAYNTQVIWEDATQELKEKGSYNFKNETFDNERYGVAVRVTISKNENTERVYAYAIGYSFD